jgi:hypothetical protein
MGLSSLVCVFTQNPPHGLADVFYAGHWEAPFVDLLW